MAVCRTVHIDLLPHPTAALQCMYAAVRWTFACLCTAHHLLVGSCTRLAGSISFFCKVSSVACVSPSHCVSACNSQT
eukprot:m.257253 g.257253  ORF g.257253 m.257253 type:complete len:77 (-) comp78852_c0_seq1:61-291(-)